MDVAMALATLFLTLLLVAFAAICLLILRLCLTAIRPSTTTPATTYSPAAAHPEAPTLPQHELALLVAPPLKATKTEPRRLAWREVEALTGGFDEAAVVGRGGSGNAVYLARQRVDGSPAAVKVHLWCSGGDRRLAAFRRELDLLRRVGRHPRLVTLGLMFSKSLKLNEGGALVLEYMSGGTLADRLHGATATTKPISWRHRMRVLHDVALALEHLHDTIAVVHGDVSASNVLLDGGAAPRASLCDLGSSCEATFSAAVAPGRRGAAAAAVGSPGYADPFFLRTGIMSKKSDVYGFGVLLLEAVTGSPAAGSDGGEYLTAKILQRVRRTSGVEGLVDVRLANEYDATEARAIANIAVGCVAAQPGLRPTMEQVRAAISEKAASSIAAANGFDHTLLDLFRTTD